MAASVVLVTLASCEIDKGKLPNIEFKTGSVYTSSDAAKAKNDSVWIGIVASKAEDKDVLTTFDASRSYDGAAAVSFSGKTLSGIERDVYNDDILIVTRNQAGTEKYTFTVVNRDGIKNSVSLTLTVQ